MGPDGRAPGDTSPLGDAAPAPKRERKKLPPVAKQTPDEREAEDIKVAQFYMNDSNFRAAYMRGQDAISISPDDWEAHFTLAEAARRLGTLDEAVTEYKKCLTLDPLPKQKKVAETALKEMVGGQKDALIP
jgi:Tfp pilus assembly protein PilF